MIEELLKTLGVDSICQWDVLVFLHRHCTCWLPRRISRGWCRTGRLRLLPRWTGWSHAAWWNARASLKARVCID